MKRGVLLALLGLNDVQGVKINQLNAPPANATAVAQAAPVANATQALTTPVNATQALTTPAANATQVSF